MPDLAHRLRTAFPGVNPCLVWAFLMGGCLTVIQATPETWHLWLRYDRAAILDYEAWRLLTGNLVHLGWGHLWLNVAGLLLIAWLFCEHRSPVQALLEIVVCCLASSIGLLLFNPEITWCVGLSGALHGLMVAGAVGWIRRGIGLGYWLLAAVVAKLAWEQIFGSVPMTAEIVGGGIVVDAHLWGALGGLCIALIEWRWSQGRGRV